MTIGEIIEMLREMDPDEEASFQLLTHSDMHIAAEAAGIEADCDVVNAALTIYSSMHRHKIGMDPFLVFRALGRAADVVGDETSEPVHEKPIFH